MDLVWIPEISDLWEECKITDTRDSRIISSTLMYVSLAKLGN